MTKIGPTDSNRLRGEQLRGEGPKNGCETFVASPGYSHFRIARHVRKNAAKLGPKFTFKKRSLAKLLRNRLASEALRRNEPLRSEYSPGRWAKTTPNTFRGSLAPQGGGGFPFCSAKQQGVLGMSRICLGLRTRRPCTGVKIPKIGKRGFQGQKTPISQCPRKGRFESKNPHFPCGGL